MSEDEFWDRLEYRVSDEMAGITECRRLGLWCDGFIPEDYRLDDSLVEIAGRVWLGLGPKSQEQWAFKLILPAPLTERGEINWDTLLPPDDHTCWISADPHEKLLTMEPGVAIAPAARVSRGGGRSAAGATSKRRSSRHDS